MPATWTSTRDIQIRDLTRFPGNARRGNVEEIRASIRRHGQYRAIVVRDTGTELVILAGNHTRDALEAEGHTAARCEVIECSDDEARRINLGDNRLSDIAEEDNRALAELLAALDGDLEGTGWTVYDLDNLADDLGRDEPTPPGDFPGYDDDIETEYQCPKCSYEWSGKPK
jgi:ParB-like chromosome segregation protein Spo0J